MGEISVAVEKTDKKNDRAVQAGKREETKDNEQLVRKKQHPPRRAVSVHGGNLSHIAIISQSIFLSACRSALPSLSLIGYLGFGEWTDLCRATATAGHAKAIDSIKRAIDRAGRCNPK